MSIENLFSSSPNFLGCGIVVSLESLESFEDTELQDDLQAAMLEHSKYMKAYSDGVMDMSEKLKEVLEVELAKIQLEGFQLGFEEGVKSVDEVTLSMFDPNEFPDTSSGELGVSTDVEEDFQDWISKIFSGGLDFNRIQGTQAVQGTVGDISVNGNIMGKEYFQPPQQNEAVEPFEDNLCDKIQMQKEPRKHSHYFKDVSMFSEIDTYLLARIWGIVDENGALFHALKKILDAGKRGGGKDKIKDIGEARDSLNRYLDIEEKFKRD